MFGFGRLSARDVAVRALLLKFVVVRALAAPPRELLEDARAAGSEEDRRTFEREAEKSSAESLAGLGPHAAKLTPWEKTLSRTSIATISLQQQVDASWRVEAYQVLIWALGIIPSLPRYDVQADHETLKLHPPQDLNAFFARATLLPQEAIAEARDLAEFWHWRSRTRQLIEEGAEWHEANNASGATSFDGIVRAAAKMAHERDGLEIIDEDFAVLGKAYRDLDAEQWSMVSSITRERHFALNWLCGYAPGNRWDETPTDT